MAGSPAGGGTLISDCGKGAQREHAESRDGPGHAVVLISGGFACLVPCEDRSEPKETSDQDRGRIKAGAERCEKAAQ